MNGPQGSMSAIERVPATAAAKVLIVEDDRDMVSVLERMLAAEGFTV